MSKEALKDLKFYCWQLDIKTFADLNNFKAAHNSNSVQQLINDLCREFNRS